MSSIKSWFVESNTGRMRALWRILLGYLLMFAVIAVLLVTVDAIEIPWIESFLWQVLAVPVLILIARLLARRVDRRRFEEYGLTWDSRAFRHLAVGAFAGVLLVSIVFLAGFVSGAIKVVSIAHTSYEIP